MPPSGDKRKRYSESSHALMVYRPYRKPYTKKRKFMPGKDRVGGYYGRYAGRDGETKFFDVDLDDAVVAATASVTASVNLIAQGITEVTRVGRKCTLRSFHWRYEVSLPEQDAQATPQGSDSIRMILYIDKQTNGATAAVTDILETDAFHSFRNLANNTRFTILCDKLHSINYNGLASDGAGVVSQATVMHQYTLNKKIHMPIEFDGVTGAITEIRTNNLGVLLISKVGVLGFRSKIRLRFSDY